MARHMTTAQIAKRNAKVEKAIARDARRREEDTCTVCHKYGHALVSFINGKAVCDSCQRKQQIEKHFCQALGQQTRDTIAQHQPNAQQLEIIRECETLAFCIGQSIIWGYI